MIFKKQSVLEAYDDLWKNLNEAQQVSRDLKALYEWLDHLQKLVHMNLLCEKGNGKLNNLSNVEPIESNIENRMWELLVSVTFKTNQVIITEKKVESFLVWLPLAIIKYGKKSIIFSLFLEKCFELVAHIYCILSIWNYFHKFDLSK